MCNTHAHTHTHTHSHTHTYTYTRGHTHTYTHNHKLAVNRYIVLQCASVQWKHINELILEGEQHNMRVCGPSGFNGDNV